MFSFNGTADESGWNISSLSQFKWDKVILLLDMWTTINGFLLLLCSRFNQCSGR